MIQMRPAVSDDLRTPRVSVALLVWAKAVALVIGGSAGGRIRLRLIVSVLVCFLTAFWRPDDHGLIQRGKSLFYFGFIKAIDMREYFGRREPQHVGSGNDFGDRYVENRQKMRAVGGGGVIVPSALRHAGRLTRPDSIMPKLFSKIHIRNRHGCPLPFLSLGA